MPPAKPHIPTALPGWRSPGVGFEQPFAMLYACHERISRSLDLLTRLRQHLKQQGADQAARDAAQDVLRYFDIAAPLHHQDEELHLFPPLLAQADAATVALVRQLQAEHLRMAAHWQTARQPLAALAAGQLQQLSLADEAALDAFVAGQAEHIAHENQHIYPQAQALLPAPAQAAIGQEMAARRRS